LFRNSEILRFQDFAYSKISWFFSSAISRVFLFRDSEIFDEFWFLEVPWLWDWR
jgi:hypothetical protein